MAAALAFLVVLSLNVGCLPSFFGIPIGLGNNKTRAKRIADIILAQMPNVDVVCLQELFDQKARKAIRKRLAGRYPHIFEDSGAGAFYFGGNSGLFLASRHRIEETYQHSYKIRAGVDNLAEKGCRGIKISIDGTLSYVFTTHLQAGGDSILEIIDDCETRKMTPDEIKLTQVTEMAAKIREWTADDLAPKMTCGDFNIERPTSDPATQKDIAIYVKIKTILDGSMVTDFFDSYDPSASPLDTSIVISGDQRPKIVDYIWISSLNGQCVVAPIFGANSDHHGIIGTFSKVDPSPPALVATLFGENTAGDPPITIKYVFGDFNPGPTP